MSRAEVSLLAPGCRIGAGKDEMVKLIPYADHTYRYGCIALRKEGPPAPMVDELERPEQNERREIDALHPNLIVLTGHRTFLDGK